MQSQPTRNTSRRRVLLVLNKPNREGPVMQSIAKALLSQDASLHVKIVAFDSHFFDAVLDFRPNIILTYPMTAVGLASFYYVFKFLFHCIVICYRTEGIVVAGSKSNIANHVGYDRYGARLVDYEIFWGDNSASAIGPVLLEQNKLSSRERVKVFGYPRLEKYFQPEEDESAELPTEISARLQEYGRARTVLLATGFHFANYTRADIFAAKDLDAENQEQELLAAIEGVKEFRAAWINSIIVAATSRPDFFFVLKKHPIERREDYMQLAKLPNVLVVWQDLDIAHLMRASGLFFHYGSTTLADAYLARVPAVHVHSPDPRCSNWYQDLGWPSDRKIFVEEISETVNEYAAGQLHFKMTEAMWKVLKQQFAIDDPAEYHPSKRIAEFLLTRRGPQRISIADSYLWRAILVHYLPKVRRIVAPPVKRVLQAMGWQFRR